MLDIELSQTTHAIKTFLVKKKKERTNKKWESMFAEAYNHESRVQLFEQTKKTGQKSK